MVVLHLMYMPWCMWKDNAFLICFAHISFIIFQCMYLKHVCSPLFKSSTHGYTKLALNFSIFSAQPDLTLMYFTVIVCLYIINGLLYALQTLSPYSCKHLLSTFPLTHPIKFNHNPLQHSVDFSLSVGRKWTHSSFWKYSLEFIKVSWDSSSTIKCHTWDTKNALRFILKSQRQAFHFQKYRCLHRNLRIFCTHINMDIVL